MATRAEQIQKARKAGFTDEQISNHFKNGG
jgi:hypothetical protein